MAKFRQCDNSSNAKEIPRTAFDHGMNHFDRANNYGVPYGSNFGSLFRSDFTPYRKELIRSSKAGYDMCAVPFGIGGSRKHLIATAINAYHVKS